jgi:hypothetical protein
MESDQNVSVTGRAGWDGGVEAPEKHRRGPSSTGVTSAWCSSEAASRAPWWSSEAAVARAPWWSSKAAAAHAPWWSSEVVASRVMSQAVAS